MPQNPITLQQRVTAAYRPTGAGGAPVVEIVRSETALTLAEIARAAVAARKADGIELHLLAWEFPPDVARLLRSAPDPPVIPVRLVRLPRELLLPWGRKPPLFVEAGELAAEMVRHPDGTRDVRLTDFRPGLPVSPRPPTAALRERAERAGFDFLDYWAVDFNYDPAEPFRHQWRCGRTSRQRRIALQSAARCPEADAGTVAVKITDVFGYETLTVLQTTR